jgi:hypothetical protein
VTVVVPGVVVPMGPPFSASAAHREQLKSFSLKLSYSSKINGYLYHHRVSPPLKKHPDVLSEGNAAPPVGCDSPLQIVMAVWLPFSLNSN